MCAGINSGGQQFFQGRAAEGGTRKPAIAVAIRKWQVITASRSLVPLPYKVPSCRGGTTTERLAGFDETGNRGASPKFGPETGRRILVLLDTKPPKITPMDGFAHPPGRSGGSFTPRGCESNDPESVDRQALRSGQRFGVLPKRWMLHQGGCAVRSVR
jgi:hypothetical protein